MFSLKIIAIGEQISKLTQVQIFDSWQSVLFGAVAIYLYLQKRRGESKISLEEIEHRNRLEGRQSEDSLRDRTIDQLTNQNQQLMGRIDKMSEANVDTLTTQKKDLALRADMYLAENVALTKEKLRVEAELSIAQSKVRDLEELSKRLRASRDSYRRISEDAAQELHMKGLQESSEMISMEISEADEAISQVAKTHLDIPPIIDHRGGDDE